MRRRGLLFLLLALLAPCAQADSAAAVRAVYTDWMSPRAAELTAASARQEAALTAYCAAPAGDAAAAALEAAREAWRAALAAWERLSATAIGPVLEQRMRRRLDFQPTRPRMIRNAVKAAPAGASDMELIGTPAKGFPALEWLLWTQPMQPASRHCRYAVQVGAEIAREARALEAGYRRAPVRRLDATAANAAVSEFVNQWIGGLERLRWVNMEKPLRMAATGDSGGAMPDFPRRASGSTALSWSAQWQALHALAIGKSPGTLASLLRERSQTKLADALVAAASRAQLRMQGLDPGDAERVMAAARELAALKRLVEFEVAAALGVYVGFSDADGD